MYLFIFVAAISLVLATCTPQPVMYDNVHTEDDRALCCVAMNKTPAAAGYAISSNDTSFVQVLVRWADQTGYTITLNQHLVDLNKFPNHPAQFIDFPLMDSVKTFATALPLNEAILQFLSLHPQTLLARFQITVDDSSKSLTILNLIEQVPVTPGQ